MRTKYMFFEFDNGYSAYLTQESAASYERESGARIVRDDFKREQESFFRMTKDGFQIGFNPALGMHIRGRKHYNQVLKERGLIEMGKERVRPNEKIERKFIDESIVKAAVDMGASLSGVEADALASGEYVKDNPPIILEQERGGMVAAPEAEPLPEWLSASAR